ncbi:MAG: tetratricopeptide repeat protein [Gammaproteobacteria bacterium]|nr:tetratricopeptide repeat protein [Gammaproteobacteria bacterium]
MAKIHYQQQKYQQAYDLFTGLIKENRFYVEAIEWLANCQIALDQTLEAQQTLEKVTALAPKNIQRQKKLAKICQENQDEAGTISALKACVRHGKHSFFRSSQEYTQLAEIYFGRKQQNKAMLLLKEARKIFKTDAKQLLNTLLLEAELQRQEKHVLDAKRLLNNMLRMIKKTDTYFEQQTLLGIATLCYHLKEKKYGLETLKKVIENNHDNRQVLETINELLESLSEHPSKPIILEHSQHISQRNDEGVALFESGKLLQAQTYFLSLSEQIPFNRSITINTVRIMILGMKNNLVSRDVMKKTQQLLARLNTIAPNEPQLPILQNALNNL